MMAAIETYRRNFRPSADHPSPHLMLGVNIVAAERDDEARFLATSGRQAIANLRRGMPTRLPPPSNAYERDVVPFGVIPLEELQAISMVGSRDIVLQGLATFVERTRPDEVIVVSQIDDHAARLRSYEIVASLQ